MVEQNPNPGLGPSHYPGTNRGEDYAKGRTEQQRKRERQSTVGPVKPIDPTSPDIQRG